METAFRPAPDSIEFLQIQPFRLYRIGINLTFITGELSHEWIVFNYKYPPLTPRKPLVKYHNVRMYFQLWLL